MERIRTYIALASVLSILEDQKNSLLPKYLHNLCEQLEVNNGDVTIKVSGFQSGSVTYREALSFCLTTWLEKAGVKGTIANLILALENIDPLLTSGIDDGKNENDGDNNNAMQDQSKAANRHPSDGAIQKEAHTVDANSKKTFWRKHKTWLLSGCAVFSVLAVLIIALVLKFPINCNAAVTSPTSQPASSSSTSAVPSPVDIVATNSSRTRNNNFKIFDAETLGNIECKATFRIHLILQDVAAFNFKNEKFKKCLPLIEILEIDGGGNMKIELFDELLSHLKKLHKIVFRNLDEYCSKSKPKNVYVLDNTLRNESSAVHFIEFRDIGIGCEDGLKKLGQIPTLQAAWNVKYHNCSFTESNVPKFADFIEMSIYPVSVICVGRKCSSLKIYLDGRIPFNEVDEYDTFLSFTKGLLSEAKK
ncbi:uncharacterized protein LOC110853308 [Folsomia candida]|uniref:uncharacterized protein LOC110853308 n=1 Tax=Folsomia candida TaxID=158441 RepID=UPI000B8F0143|nr:uncharacterized protein LOC110853308 [Folsomia candida]